MAAELENDSSLHATRGLAAASSADEGNCPVHAIPAVNAVPVPAVFAV